MASLGTTYRRGCAAQLTMIHTMLSLVQDWARLSCSTTVRNIFNVEAPIIFLKPTPYYFTDGTLSYAHTYMCLIGWASEWEGL
jgi:hypothetical protein